MFFKLSPEDLSAWQKAIKQVTPVKKQHYAPPSTLDAHIKSALRVTVTTIPKRSNSAPFLNNVPKKAAYTPDYGAPPTQTPLIVAKKERKKLRQQAIQTEVDLHGYNGGQAIKRLEKTIVNMCNRGENMLLVIHGKGINSLDGTAVLRPLVQEYLSQHPAVFQVLEEHHGGAVRVRLRIRKNV